LYFISCLIASCRPLAMFYISKMAFISSFCSWSFLSFGVFSAGAYYFVLCSCSICIIYIIFMFLSFSSSFRISSTAKVPLGFYWETVRCSRFLKSGLWDSLTSLSPAMLRDTGELTSSSRSNRVFLRTFFFLLSNFCYFRLASSIFALSYINHFSSDSRFSYCSSEFLSIVESLIAYLNFSNFGYFFIES
jgi:hypothetical protein